MRNLPAMFSAQLLDKAVRYLCGFLKDVGSPYVHALLALKHSCKMAPMIDFFHDSWKLSTFMDAYFEKAKANKRPTVVKDFLTRGVRDTPSFIKNKGVLRKDFFRKKRQRQSI